MEGEISRKIINTIDSLTLKEMSSDFPPLFTVKESRLDILVSEKARAALEATNIQGIRFTDGEDETTA
jgi:hypothetical protein